MTRSQAGRRTVAVLSVVGLLAMAGPAAQAREAAPGGPDPQAVPESLALRESLRSVEPYAGQAPAAPPAGAAVDPAAPVPVPRRAGGNVQVSRDEDPAAGLRSGASQLTLAASADGSRLVAGWYDAEGLAFAPFQPSQPPLGASGFGFSSDGGRTWTDGGAPPAGDRVAFGPGPAGHSETGQYVTRGDPWLAEDGAGGFYYVNMGAWSDDFALSPAGLTVHRGSFRGRGFAWDEPVLIQSPDYPRDFLDRPALAADRVGGRTALYVSVTNFEEVCGTPFLGFGTIELYRSPDGGSTWSTTVVQPDETAVTDPGAPDCGSDGVVNQGTAPAVGPDGEVYVAWERGYFAPTFGGGVLPRATIAVAGSTDRGATFSAPAQAASVCSLAQDAPAGSNRTSLNDFPRIDVAPSGPHRGRVYVTYNDCRAASGDAPFGPDGDLYVTFSDDRGATWSTPRPVHPVADGRLQTLPSLSVSERGRVDVTYYEMRDVNLTPDPDDIECSLRTGGPLGDPVLKRSTVTTLSDTFVVSSRDGGRTWGRPLRLTDVSTNWCAATPINSGIPNFGDYNASVSRGDDVLVAWADGRNAGLVDRVPTAHFTRRRR